MIPVASVVALVVVAAWFSGRTRLGVRVRALAGSVRWWERHRALLSRVLIGVLAGIVVGGVIGGVIGGSAGAAVAPVRRRRERARRAVALDEGLIDVARGIAAGLRAGLSLPQALEAAANDASGPVRDALDRSIAHVGAGASMDQALSVFSSTAGTAESRALADTLRIGSLASANLPAILDLTVAAMTDRRRIARDRAAASAQARLSGVVIGLLPVAFFVVVGAGARAQFLALLRDPLGWGLLASGVTLQVGGALWMRALVRG